jgi:hypothetical protein
MTDQEIIDASPDVIWKRDLVPFWENAIADPVIAYVLVRTDMPDFRWGRTCAQVHHCGTQMTEDKIAKTFPDLDKLYSEWLADPVLELAAAKAILAEAEAEALAEAQKLEGDSTFDVRVAKEIACDAARKARRTFGTVLTLAVSASEMRQAVSLAQLLGMHAGVTHDPTYPIFVKDGDRTQVVTAPVDSCAYVFGRKSSCAPVLGRFDLLAERHII